MPPYSHTYHWWYPYQPKYCSWLVVGYSILSQPLSTGVETAATTAHPRNGYPALSPKVPPTVLVACTIPVAWLEVPPLRSGLSTTRCAGGLSTTLCAGGQVPSAVLMA